MYELYRPGTDIPQEHLLLVYAETFFVVASFLRRVIFCLTLQRNGKLEDHVTPDDLCCWDSLQRIKYEPPLEGMLISGC